MDLTFNLPIAPGFSNACRDSVVIAPDACSKSFELWDARCLGSRQPSIQIACPAVPKQATKLLRQMFGQGNLRMVIGNSLHPLMFLRLALRGRLAEPEGDQSQTWRLAAARRLLG